MISQGTQNNLSGMAIANEVLAFCQRQGFTGRTKAALRGQGWGGKDTQISVLLNSCPLLPNGLGIDITSQDGKGTGANKIPSKVWAICQWWRVPGVLILEGEGTEITANREYARTLVGQHWLREGNCNNLLAVVTLAEFESWFLEQVRAKKFQQQVIAASAPKQKVQTLSLFDQTNYVEVPTCASNPPF